MQKIPGLNLLPPGALVTRCSITGTGQNLKSDMHCRRSEVGSIPHHHGSHHMCRTDQKASSMLHQTHPLAALLDIDLTNVSLAPACVNVCVKQCMVVQMA